MKRRSVGIGIAAAVVVVGLGILAAWRVQAARLAGGPPPRGPTVPRPRNEPDWIRQHNRNVARALAGHVDLLFLGDSITAGWFGTGRDMYDGDGLVIWNRRYRTRRAANFGIGSDRVEHLLWRIRHGELANLEPKAVVLLIGTNNVGIDPPEAIARGIEAVVETIHRRSPRSRILLIGLFPRGISPRHRLPSFRDRPDPRIAAVNRRIAELERRPEVVYLEFGDRFLDEDGLIPQTVMTDYLHLSRLGYQIWAEEIEPVLEILVGPVPRRDWDDASPTLEPTVRLWRGRNRAAAAERTGAVLIAPLNNFIKSFN